jgi:poly(3-hydroxybutyrate) depolymerase
MALLTAQPVSTPVTRTYSVEVPDNPPQASIPAIIVFHGGGQDVATIAARWGVQPPAPVPALVQNYLLVFPETHPQLDDEWVHYGPGNSAFPTLDLDFVRDLVAELTTRAYATTSVAVPTVTADPTLIYAAGFSNGGGMVWQLLNSDLSASFRGFAAVGKALDPDKAIQYRRQLAACGAVPAPAPAPVAYLQGTADTGYRPPLTQQEQTLDETLPFFTLTEMLNRNGIAAGPAATRLIPGSTGLTEVVLQRFAGAEAYLHGTVVNGGHNWPTPTSVGNPPVATHFNTTEAIVEFWQANAALP